MAQKRHCEGIERQRTLDAATVLTAFGADAGAKALYDAFVSECRLRRTRHDLRRRPRRRLRGARRAHHHDLRTLRRRLSHNEAEWTDQAQCAAGAQVLLNAVLEFDRRLG